MAIPVVCEGPTQQMTYSSAGYTFARIFTVIAKSEVDALDVLADEESVYKGAIYVSPKGEYSDVLTVCSDLTVATRVAPNATVALSTGLYEVTANYRRASYSYTESQTGADAVECWFEDALISEPIDTAYDASNQLSVPIANSAGEPFEGVTTETNYETFVVRWTRYYQGIVAAQAYCRPYKNKTNAGVWWGCEAECLRCVKIEVSAADKPIAEGQSTFPFRFTGYFSYRPPRNYRGRIIPGWNDAIRDRGRMQIANGQRTNIMDPTDPKLPIANEVDLNGGGQPAATGAFPVWMPFRKYATANFAGLQIPEFV